MTQLICPCCGLPQTEPLRRGYYVSEPICYNCFIAWYDECGSSDALVIRRQSRLNQGYTMETYEP